jgi:hypothetical protein
MRQDPILGLGVRRVGLRGATTPDKTLRAKSAIVRLTGAVKACRAVESTGEEASPRRRRRISPAAGLAPASASLASAGLGQAQADSVPESA